MQLLCGWTHAGTNCCSCCPFVASPAFPSVIFNSWSFVRKDFERSRLWSPIWAQICLCTEPAEIAVTRGQALGSGQPLGHRTKVTVSWKSKRQQSSWPLSAALAPFSQGKRKGTRLSCSRSTAFTSNTKTQQWTRGNLHLTSQATGPPTQAPK